MSKTYKIIFSSRSWAAIALWELHAWNISDSKYSLNVIDNVIYHASAGVVDVITESIPLTNYSIEIE